MERIILPLDGFDSEDSIMCLVREIQTAEMLAGESLVWGFKVNDALVTYGTDIIRKIKDEGFRVMADPKLFDIPNTMTNSLKKLISAGADMVTVHCSARYKPPVELLDKVAGVTVLTSINDDVCINIYGRSVGEMVEGFAGFVRNNNYGYLVCSARDYIYLPLMDDIKIICPGIRPKYYQDRNEDQKRVATPAQAMDWGAELLVIGRPILKADNRIDAIKRTNDEIRYGLSLNIDKEEV